MGMQDDEHAAKSKSEVPQEIPPESHLVSSSTKRNSMFSLTVNEFEGRSGKSFGSMNIDELLNSIWSVEGNQIPFNSIQSEVVSNKEANVVVAGKLPRQGSFSIPIPLYYKTVDEVWEEIHRNQSPQRFPNVIRNDDRSDRQESFGEMTLEDFLIKVGVIQEASDLSPRQKIVDHSFQNQCENLGSNNNSCLDPRIVGAGGPVMGLGFCHPNSENNFLGNGSSSYQMFTPNGFFVGESSTNIGNRKSNAEIDVVREPGSKPRKKNGSMELAVERRQRRMIKNRESAARSRARKQAYTVELEMKLTQLRGENARLKRILAKAQNKPKAEAEDENIQKPETEELKVKPSTEPVVRTSKKFKTVRRTSSSAW